jgi:hypothetical protein
MSDTQKPTEETTAPAEAAETPAPAPAVDAPAEASADVVTEVPPAAATEEPPKEEETKKEVTPATEGVLGYKAPGLK